MPIDLSQIDTFRELPHGILTRLGMLSRARTFSAGKALMREGDASDCLYVILSGRVRVEVLRPDRTGVEMVVELGPGQVVGALGVLDGQPCPATVTAIEEVEGVELGYIALALARLQYPEALTSLLATLGRRPCTPDGSAG